MRVQSVSSLDMQKYALRAKDLGISEAKVDARMRFSVVRIVDELVFVCFFIFKTHGPVQFSLANTVIGGGILSLPLALKVRVQNGSVLMRILVSIAGLHSASLRSSLSFSCRCTRSTCSWSAPTTRACRPRRPIEVSAAHDELLCYKRASWAEIARKCFGPAGVMLTDICMILSCFGVVTSYVIIVSDSIMPLILLVRLFFFFPP